MKGFDGGCESEDTEGRIQEAGYKREDAGGGYRRVETGGGYRREDIGGRI
jgi:hypothetical protein